MTARQLPTAYEFVRELGAGAFGDVVLAEQRSLGRMVAIKRIHQFALTDPEAVVRFRREGQVLAGLRDPTIVRVYDFLLTDSNALLIMELVDGTTLADLISDGELPAQPMLRVLADVARALTVAARAGVAHRDVKPGNVFVLRNGRAKLGDFGLARVVSDPSVFRTSDGRAGGTPAYFPPEVSQGAEPDERADAYSFAVTAYEVLTGRKPIRADNPMALVVAHWTQSIERPDAFIAGFPARAADALMLGMAKRPEDRLLPAELVARLMEVPAADWCGVTRSSGTDEPGEQFADRTRYITTAAGAPVVSGPLVRDPSVRSPRRRWGRWPLIAAVVLLASGGTAAAVVLSRSGNPTNPTLAVRSATVSITPADGRGRCPGTRFDFIGRIATNGGRGTLVATWLLPGDHETAPQRIEVRTGQRVVTVGVHFPVTGQRPLRGRAALQVDSTTSLTARSATITYVC